LADLREIIGNAVRVVKPDGDQSKPIQFVEWSLYRDASRLSLGIRERRVADNILDARAACISRKVVALLLNLHSYR